VLQVQELQEHKALQVPRETQEHKALQVQELQELKALQV
jgi:hypothetical protein